MLNVFGFSIDRIDGGAIHPYRRGAIANLHLTQIWNAAKWSYAFRYQITDFSLSSRSPPNDAHDERMGVIFLIIHILANHYVK